MIAIVPARSGSKGLPGKNLKSLLGKPMIVYTIEEALKSRYISDVIVSTDCVKIAKVAIEFGAKVPFLRPFFLATDNSKAIDTYIFTIDKLNSMFNYDIKDFIVLQPTSPLRITEDIDGAIKLFRNKKADSVVTYTEEHHPIKWHKYINEYGKLENIFEENISNRQNYKKSYYPNGAVFVFKHDLIKENKYYSKNSYAYIMPGNRSVDVDTIDDFKYIEFLLNKRNEK